MPTRNRTPRAVAVRPNGVKAGFTIIEVLIALALMVTVLAISSTPIVNAFGMTARSRRTVSGTSAAQQVLEVIRGQWLTLATYDSTCVSNYTLPTGVNVTVSAFDTRYNAFSTPTPTFAASTSNCSGTSVTAPIKRVTVTVTSNSTTQATVTLEIARP